MEQGCPGELSTATEAFSTSLVFSPSNFGDCLSDGWAGRAVSQWVRDSESAGVRHVFGRLSVLICFFEGPLLRKTL